MRKLGGSQPNLSNLTVVGDILADDDDNNATHEDVDDDFAAGAQEKGAPLYPTLRQRVLSNPNLLDCVDEPAKVTLSIQCYQSIHYSTSSKKNKKKENQFPSKIPLPLFVRCSPPYSEQPSEPSTGPSTRKKSAMVAEWENRIRLIQESK